MVTLTDVEAERLLAGWDEPPPEWARLAAALETTRATLDDGLPRPTAALAAVLAGGIPPATVTTTPWRRRAATAVGGLGLTAKLALGVGVAVAGVGVAHHEGLLENPLPGYIERHRGPVDEPGRPAPSHRLPEPTRSPDADGHAPEADDARGPDALPVAPTHRAGPATETRQDPAPSSGAAGDPNSDSDEDADEPRGPGRHHDEADDQADDQADDEAEDQADDEADDQADDQADEPVDEPTEGPDDAGDGGGAEDEGGVDTGGSGPGGHSGSDDGGADRRD